MYMCFLPQGRASCGDLCLVYAISYVVLHLGIIKPMNLKLTASCLATTGPGGGVLDLSLDRGVPPGR